MKEYLFNKLVGEGGFKKLSLKSMWFILKSSFLITYR